MLKKYLQSYLKFWAKQFIKRTKPEIIAVTGSYGKTSAKDAIYEVLKVKFGNNVRKAQGNLNSHTSLPLAILNFRKGPSFHSNVLEWLPVFIAVPFKSLFLGRSKMLVLEYAADKPGDIKYLTSIAQPKIAVITGIGPAHLEAFGEIELIAKEKMSLAGTLPVEGWAVLNYDSDLVREYSADLKCSKKTYAINEQASLVAKNVITEINNFQPLTTFQISTEAEKFKIVSKTLGRQSNVSAILAAVGVGKIYDMSDKEIALGAANFKMDKHRLAVLEGKKHSIIIDDSYNANPISMKAALDVLKLLPAKRKFAVIGDMLEIGKVTEESHRILGEYAHEVAHEVIAVGREASENYHADHFYKNIDEAVNYLSNRIQDGDIILVKASRGIELDRIVDAIKA